MVAEAAFEQFTRVIESFNARGPRRFGVQVVDKLICDRKYFGRGFEFMGFAFVEWTVEFGKKRWDVDVLRLAAAARTPARRDGNRSHPLVNGCRYGERLRRSFLLCPISMDRLGSCRDNADAKIYRKARRLALG
jgi:hypothetical protein